MNWNNVGWKDNSQGQGEAYRRETQGDEAENNNEQRKTNECGEGKSNSGEVQENHGG